MPAERSQQIEQLYHAARERDPDQRAAFLEQACAGDDALQREVESLLAEDDGVESFLETAALEFVRKMSGEDSGQSMVGRQLGSYSILSLLAKGGMGEVYRAFDTRLHRTVAIKVLPRDRLGDPELKRRFLQEARAASALTHPNIVTLYDICNDGKVDFLVLEYVSGRTLDRLIPPKGMALAETLEYVVQIANALAAAHAAGIVHRDIKPENVIVTPESQVKVLDFGLAKLAEPAGVGPESETRASEPSLTHQGMVMGTPAYMSPEQARAEKVDARTDLFSFGAVVYEMATGRRAFPKPLDWTLPPAASVHPELYRIILKLLEPDPQLRYQTALDVVADLKRLKRASESRGKGRRWRMKASASVLVVVLAIALIWLWAGRRLPRENQWVQLTNMPDSVSQPALSPDGRMLTFIRGPATFYTPGQIFVKILPDGDPVQLTRDDYLKMSPVFSPDGSRIAYTVVPPGQGKPWDTWVVPVLGGQAREWLPNASGLAWIDKKNLLFSEFKEPFPHLAIVAAEESRVGARDLYVPAHERGMAHRSYPSPDGKWALVVEMDHNGDWLPCRLLPIDGSSPGRQVGPPDGECTFAAWSADGKWIYLSSKAGGAFFFHTWRQRFPDGEPEQVTSGPTEEEGVAVAPDSRSFITAMALKQSSVWVHDLSGDRQISLEGYAFQPRFSPDGKRLYYRILKGGSISSGTSERQPTELWVAELESGGAEPALPGFPIFGRLAYDLSPDGRQAVVSALDSEGKSRLWLARLDRKSVRQIPNVEGYQPMFGPPGEVLFHTVEGNSEFAYRVREDGTELRKAIEEPVFEIKGVSPGGRWLVGWSPLSSKETITVAFPLGGGSPVRITNRGHAFLKWSPEGRSLLITPGLLASATKSYLIPLPPGQMLPRLPAGGLPATELSQLPGARLIDFGDVALGPTPDVYAFSRETVQRNLYRVPVP